MRYESGERGLLRAALSSAIAANRGLDVIRRRRTDLFVPHDPADAVWSRLRKLVPGLRGTIEGFPDLLWREGVGTRLDWADDRLWLLIQPRIVFDGVTDENRFAATEFARERSVKRYNRVLNDLIAFWAQLLSGNGADMRALRISDGVDAVFSVGSNTAYSRRVGA